MKKRTEERDVAGLVSIPGNIAPMKITVRVTSDKLGESLSLAVDDVGLMMQIPLESVSDMVRVVK